MKYKYYCSGFRLTREQYVMHSEIIYFGISKVEEYVTATVTNIRVTSETYKQFPH